MDGAAMGALGLGIVLTLRDEASGIMDDVRKKLQGVTGATKEMMDRFDQGAKLMIGGAATMGVGAMILSTAFAAPIQAAIEFESVMADVNKVANFTTEQYNEMSGALIEMSKRIPLAASELGQIMAAAAQAGIAKEDLLAFTEDAAKMGVAFDISAREAGDAMTGLRSIFQLSQKDVVSLGDAVNHLANNMNATAPNILNFLNRAGGIGRQAGMSGQQLAALGATFIDLKTPPELASRAVSSLIMKLTTASQAGKDTQAAFQKLGLTGPGMEKAFKKDATGAIMTFLEAVNKSSDPIGALRSIMGEGFADDIAKLSGGVDKLKIALGMVGDESVYAGSMLGEYETRSKTVENALQLLDNRFQAIRMRIGNILLPIFGGLVDRVSAFVKGISELPEPVYVVLTALTGLAGVALLLAGGLMVVGGAMKAWVVLSPLAYAALGKIKMGAVDAIRALAGAALPLVGLIALGGALYYAWQQNWGGIRDTVTAVVEGFNMALNAGEDGIARVDAKTAAKLKELGIWDFAVTMGRVFYRIRLLWQGFVQGFNEGIGLLKGGLLYLRDAFAPLLDGGRFLLEWLGILNPMAESSSKTWKDWGREIGIATVAVLAVIAAFKMAGIIVSIVKGITGAVGMLNAVLMANPIVGIAVVAIAALTLLAMYWDGFGDAVAMVMNGIYNIVTGVWDILVGICQGVVALLAGDWEWLGQSITRVIGGVLKVVSGALETIAGLMKPITDGILWILEKMGIISAPEQGPGAFGENNSDRAFLEDVGYKFDEKGSVIGVPEETGAALDAKIEAAKAKRASTPAAAPLAQQSQNQATATAQATTTALKDDPRQQEIKANVTVKNEPAPVYLTIDGEKIAEGVVRYMDHQEIRSGSAE